VKEKKGKVWVDVDGDLYVDDEEDDEIVDFEK